MSNHLYTLKDILQMTNLSERTLRRYIKNSTLKGYKVGGEWRFTEEQVKALFNETEFIKSFSEKASQVAKDFINEDYEVHSDIEICSIIDIYNKNKKTIKDIQTKILEVSNQSSHIKMNFIADEKKVRLTLVGNYDYINKIMKILEGF